MPDYFENNKPNFSIYFVPTGTEGTKCEGTERRDSTK